MQRVFYCPNCGEEFIWTIEQTTRFPFCTTCNILTRKRPPRLRQPAERIDLTARGAALMLLYENVVRKLPPQPQNDAFFQIVAGLMQDELLTVLNHFAHTPQHGTANRNRS